MPTRNPNALRELPNAGIRRVSAQATDETYATSMFMIAQSVTAAVGAGTTEAMQRVIALAQGLEKLTTSSKSQMAQVHTRIGRQMQDATVAAYRAHPKRATPLYRESSRDAGGRLLAALRSPQMFRGTYDGIGFVNTTMLDKEARQWHRLNFGAKGTAGGGAITRAVTATWDGIVIGAFGFTDESSSKGFALPRGVWVGAGGEREQAGASRTGMFYPQSERKLLSGRGILGRPNDRRMTKGIRAWNFLDEGVKVLAAELGPAYSDLYAGWFASASRGAGPLSGQVNLPPPRVTPFRRV